MPPRLSVAILGLALLATALQADEQISPLHPRVYVRHDEAAVGKGLTVSELRLRLKDPAYARWRRPAGGQGTAATLERAARYLEEGKPADLAAVREFLLTHTYTKPDVGGFLAGAEMATAFDWVYAGLSPEDRAAAMANIVTTAETSRSFLLRGAPDINHNYTYMALNTLAVCGMVLRGEPAPYDGKAKEYLALARKWMEAPGKALDTWKAREGAWAEGSHYTFHETLRTFVLALAAYRTATDVDYFASKYRGSLIQAGRFLMAATRPDMTFERVGDCLPSRALANGTVPLTVEMLAFGLNGAEEAARLRSFSHALCAAYGEKALHSVFDWGMRIFFNPATAREPSYRTLPPAMRMGSGTYEHIVFRNGWRPESTQVTILAGDHFTDHQHFDKGHFLIYRRGGLAIDGGAYDGMYKPGHWNEYACRTVAHNCVLVYDPDQPFPAGYGNDGGQTVIRGKQHHADWNAYLSHREGEGLHAAEVSAYDSSETDGCRYVRANLTKAYGEKVSHYDRQFVYLPGPDFLVVFDRVSAARTGFAKRWLLHFQEAPSIDGVTPEPGVRSFPGARLAAVRRRGRLDLGGSAVDYDGALFVRTLLPAAHTITVVGGPGYEYFNPFAGLNYPPSNAALAADLRESGNWRMEVMPDIASTDDQFLHALQIADGTAVQPVDARLVRAGENKLVGVQFLSSPENHVVCFASAQKGGQAPFPISYEISSSSPARHYLAELPASRQVVVEVDRRKMPVQKVNSQGVLAFRDQSRGTRKIVIRLGDPPQPVRDRTHFSRVLSENRNYRVFLPRDYEASSKRYPVIYYFHGHSDRYTLERYDNGTDTVPKIAAWVAAHDAIVVAVDGYVARDYTGFYGGSPWDVRLEGGDYDFGAYFHELIAHIDSTYRTLPGRRYRATAGLSMGGFMSLWLSSRYPQSIGSASAFNPGPEFYVGDKGRRQLWRPKDHVGNHTATMVRLIRASGDYISQYHEETRDAYARAHDVDFEYRQDEYHRHWATSIAETFDFHLKAFSNAALDRVPETWNHTNAYRRFEVWGYRVDSDGKEPAIIHLQKVNRDGLRVTTRRWAPDGPPAANHFLTIKTAPIYKPGQLYQVLDYGLATGKTASKEVTADSEGRITVSTDGLGHQISIAGAGIGKQAAVLLPVTRSDRLRVAPNTDVPLPLRIYNPGSEPITGLKVVLSSDYPTVRFPADSVAMAKLEGGAAEDLSGRLLARFTSGGGYFAAARLRVSIKSDGQPEVSENLDVLIAPEIVPRPLAVEILDGRAVTLNVFRQKGNQGGGESIQRTITEGKGNGNGILEPGEEATIWVKMAQGMDPFDKNNWYRAKVYSDSPWIAEIADIQEPKQREWTSAMERTSLIRLLPDTPPGAIVPLLLDNESWSFHYTPDVRYGVEKLYQAFQLHTRHLHRYTITVAGGSGAE